MAFNLRKIRNITSKELTTVGVKTTNYTANSFERIVANSVGGAFDITLPSRPLHGDRIEIVDIGGAANINPYTILRNGKLINGQPTDSELNVPYGSTSLLYTEELGWVDYWKWVSVSPAEVLYMHSNFGGF